MIICSNIFGGIHLRGHRAGVTSVKFSLHYPLLYSVSKDGDMRCWRAEDLECGGIYKGHRYPIWCMDESPVGMYLATGSKDLTARLWSLEKNFPLITYIGHTQDVEVRQSFSKFIVIFILILAIINPSNLCYDCALVCSFSPEW